MHWQKPTDKDPSGGNPQPDDPGKTGFPKDLKTKKQSGKNGAGEPSSSQTVGRRADLG